MLDVVALSGVPLGFFLVFGLGFLIAAVGHLFQVRALVVLGIALVFTTVVVVPTLLWLAA